MTLAEGLKRTLSIERVVGRGVREVRELAHLLKDSVDGGASVGYHAPLDQAQALEWAEGVLDDAAAGRLLLLIARDSDGTALGTVQLAPSPKPNGARRAELQKLLVHSRYRRRGVGEALMRAAEEWAAEAGRTLLVLDTLRGDSGERLYARLDWQRVGVIPGYTVEADGGFGDTVVFYKDLDVSPDTFRRRKLAAPGPDR